MLFLNCVTKWAYLANGLQNVDACAEVADVEDGQLEVDVAVVTNARGQVLAARVALLVLLAGTLCCV